MRKLLFGILICILPATHVQAKRLHKESYYQNNNCEGIIEFKLVDSTRVDCLTSKYAIEFDFANKWAEAIGQSLHYGRLTNKKSAIALIMEKESDQKYYDRLLDNINHYNLPIKIWQIKE